MNPEERAEREELARLLPSPGDPVLTSDRHDLLKDHLMRELTQDAPETGATPKSQGAQDTAATRAPRKPAARPRRRFAMIAIPLATATAVATTVVIATSASETPSTDQEAVDLLNRIAAVAATKETEPVRDDQYVYIRTQGAMDTRLLEEDIRIHRKYRDSRWTAVDGKRQGLSRMTVLNGPPPKPRDPLNAFARGTRDMTLSPDPNVTTYRELEALPTDPDVLIEKIYADTKGQGPTHYAAALEAIGGMLDEATLLPEVGAALYRAAAKIPGVSVVENTKDFAGRPGIGLSFKDRDDRGVWVFDKESLNYLGSDKEALLGVGVVDKIGQKPGN
ncbi:CU044_5270 family protein [Streptomyces sp. NBC_00286]|uniref:CU044_5270 family protein n=1 Tax=Streptomyces sp. NBC_00286 TaxID=2975701 RepID=UPI002E2A1A8B|nr:CU044_5270 family protein [Streptomyces sp. NBC_00286]